MTNDQNEIPRPRRLHVFEFGHWSLVIAHWSLARGMLMNDPLLRMDGISKAFPGVRALESVSLDLRAGEVLALLGENGAGKSTLIKVLGGAHLPDSGSLHLSGVEKQLRNPVEARRAGIAVIYQEFNLVPT